MNSNTLSPSTIETLKRRDLKLLILIEVLTGLRLREPAEGADEKFTPRDPVTVFSGGSSTWERPRLSVKGQASRRKRTAIGWIKFDK